MTINCPKCKKPFEYRLEDGVILRECDCESVSPPMNKIPIMQLFRLCIGSGTIPYKEPPKYVCEKIITCWYKLNDIWETGFFHQWTQTYEEFETGPGHYPAAIIEDATDSQVHVVYAGNVSFNPDHPDPLIKAELEQETIKGSVYEWLKKEEPTFQILARWDSSTDNFIELLKHYDGRYSLHGLGCNWTLDMFEGWEETRLISYIHHEVMTGYYNPGAPEWRKT